MCFMCAIVLGIGIYALWASDGEVTEKLTGSIFLFAILIFAIYVGIVGQGWNYSDFTDDMGLYRKIKKKYNLRW